MDIDLINEAFSPSREIDDPEMFVGRKDEIKDGILALQNPGGFIAIYGPRGVGKSSIALQLKLIAEGSMVLANMLDLKRYIPGRGFNFLVHYVRCDQFVLSTTDLFKRILFGDEQNPSLFSLTSAGEKRLRSVRKIIEAEGGIGALGIKAGAKAKEESEYSVYVSNDMVQQFRKILGAIRKMHSTRDGLLILIDEFDVIRNKSGFASIVKSYSNVVGVKFGIIGIAHNIAELMQEHGSIGRQVDAIRVRKMDKYELELILRRAEHRAGKRIVFRDEVKEAIVSKAEGYPYFMHFLGKGAMLLAFERNIKEIDANLLWEVEEKVAHGRLPTIYEEIYHQAVQGSPEKEMLLKALADHEKDDIFFDSICELVKGLGVSNPSTIVKDFIVSKAGEPILVETRDNYYRFSDPVFRIYAKMRRWEF